MLLGRRVREPESQFVLHFVEVIDDLYLQLNARLAIIYCCCGVLCACRCTKSHLNSSGH